MPPIMSLNGRSYWSGLDPFSANLGTVLLVQSRREPPPEIAAAGQPRSLACPL